MSNQKFEITNPEAIQLISNIKSGAIFLPFKNWLVRYKWYLIGSIACVIVLLAAVIGKAISEKNKPPIFLPPSLESPRPSTGSVIRSDYEWIRESILNFSSDLPDPVIPPFDNSINLESANI